MSLCANPSCHLDRESHYTKLGRVRKAVGHEFVELKRKKHGPKIDRTPKQVKKTRGASQSDDTIVIRSKHSGSKPRYKHRRGNGGFMPASIHYRITEDGDRVADPIREMFGI